MGFSLSDNMNPPTRVSKIVHRHSKRVAVMITKQLASTDWDSYRERSDLRGWLNGVAIPETNPDVKREIRALAIQVGQYEAD